MLIKTTRVTHKSAANIWNGITNAEMILSRPLCFRVGIPLPRKCEILEYKNGLGKKRKCTSDRGSVIQEITKYAVNEELEFRMEYNTLEIPYSVREMRDHFKISAENNGKTKVVRTTTIELNNDALKIKSLSIMFGIKAVHKFVFDNIDAT
jgi:hypothetical protein